jgi:hypothetical protein
VGFLIFLPIIAAFLVVFLVFACIHIVVTIFSTVLGVVAVATDRGRRAGIVGLVLTGLANVVTCTVVFLLIQASNTASA